MSGQKIIDGIKDAVAGNFGRVTINGQTWERVTRDETDPPAEQEVAHLAEQCAHLLKENERLATLLQDAEIALCVWDEGRNSEYWLRHPERLGEDAPAPTPHRMAQGEE